MSDFSDKLTSLANKFKYHATVLLTPEDPPAKVRQELVNEGWNFRASMTEEEVKKQILSSAFVTPIVAVPVVFLRVSSPEGKEVFGEKADEGTKQQYREAVKRAAAKVYNVNP